MAVDARRRGLVGGPWRPVVAAVPEQQGLRDGSTHTAHRDHAGTDAPETLHACRHEVGVADRADMRDARRRGRRRGEPDAETANERGHCADPHCMPPAPASIDSPVFHTLLLTRLVWADQPPPWPLRQVAISAISEAGYLQDPTLRRPATRRRGGPQFAMAAPGTGLMWANMLRAFQVGNARTSHDGPSSRMRESRTASAQVSWPACHLTKASASAVM